MSIKTDLLVEKEQLIERLSIYLEEQNKLAPLAAKVYSSLILTGEKGLTFDQLVRTLNASKSTICTHLNSLQCKEMISFYTAPGERKRFFIVAPNRLHVLIEELNENWKKQTSIQEDILDYKSKYNALNPAEAFDLGFHRSYLEFLQQASQSISKLKLNIINDHSSSNE